MFSHFLVQSKPGILLVILFNILQNSTAQILSPSFQHYGPEEGLPSSEVYCVLQDKPGNIWLSTDRGVSRYDGYSFRTFTYRDGLIDNTVFKLREDFASRIWMLSLSGRIFYCKNDTVYPYRFNNILAEATQNRVPQNFYVDDRENVIVALRNFGELSISSEGKSSWLFKIPDSAAVNFRLHEVSYGNFNSCFYNPNTDHQNMKIAFTGADYSDTISFDASAEERITAIRIAKDSIAFSFGKCLYIKTGKKFPLIRNFGSNILSIFEDDKKRLWIGTENGLFLISNYNKSTEPSGYLVKNNITCITQDKEGGIWFTTLDNGVYFLPGYQINGILFTGEEIQKPVSITHTNGTLYVGCWNGSLLKINNSKIRVLNLQGYLKQSPVNNLTSFKNDNRLFLSCLAPGYLHNDKFYKFKSSATVGIKTDYIRSSDGSFFCAGSSLVFRITNDSIYSIGYVPQKINCLAELNENELLVGGNTGVLLIDKTTGNHKPFLKELSDIRVDDIEKQGNTLFFATKGKGLLIASGDTIIKADESAGLSSNLVNKISIDKGIIWCSSNKGISKIIFKNNDWNKIEITNIHNDDGLFTDEINDLTILNDTVFVVTNKGISFFRTDADFVNHTPPPVYINSVLVNNSNEFNGGKLNYSQNNLRISYTGISYRSNKKIIYKYLLINGRDTITSVTGNRVVDFPSLRPGEYQFTVSAMNNSGIWSKKPAELSFVIFSPWWQTGWFIAFCILLLISLIYFIYRFNVKRVKINYEYERKQASLQLTAMRAQMNPHFIFNAMNSIRNYMQNHNMKSAEKYLISFSKLVRYTLDNSEMQEVTLEEELNALQNYVELEMQGFENGFNFKINIEKDIDTSETVVLSMILQPFVENSIKHGINNMGSAGNIEVNVSKENGRIIISIDDNGIGINENVLRENVKQTPHGTSILFQRINAYNKVYQQNIKATIIGLKNSDGNSAGTRVKIEF